MKEWKEIESKARQIGDQEIKINDRISLVQMVSGNYKPAIDGNQTDPTELSAEDQNTIRREFGIEEIHDYDSNPLIPDDGVPLKKEEPSENEFDKNELIPD